MTQNKQDAVFFLKMCSSSAEDLLAENLVDNEINAMTLTHNLYQNLGAMKFYFEHVERDTYNVKPWEPLKPILHLLNQVTFNKTIQARSYHQRSS